MTFLCIMLFTTVNVKPVIYDHALQKSDCYTNKQKISMIKKAFIKMTSETTGLPVKTRDEDFCLIPLPHYDGRHPSCMLMHWHTPSSKSTLVHSPEWQTAPCQRLMLSTSSASGFSFFPISQSCILRKTRELSSL